MITDRIKKIADYQGVNISSLEKKIGASDGVLRRSIKNGSDLHTKWLIALSDIYPKINPTWLLTGRGEMLLGSEPGKPEVVVYKEGEVIPLIPVEAMAGWGSGAVQVMEYDLKRYVIPEFTELKVDFMIPVRGSSMYPKYNSGDLVACRKLPVDTFFQWNKVYVLDTVQGAMIKRVKPSEKEGCINCLSDNEKYEPFELHLSEIYSLALVVGVIRLE